MDNQSKYWWKNAVIYQVYTKSFKDSNGDGIGDLPGVIEKLDYIKKLGVDAIWLNPVYVSPQIDNGYDVADYRKIDPSYGDNGDLRELIAKAHKIGLKIIMDLVSNQTSDQSTWFKESKKSKNNYFSDFYIWKDPKSNGDEPNNWGSNFGGSAWTYVPERKQYYLHYYAKEQPDLNWENPIVREAIYDIMRYWKSQGVDGWRMDVITSISKDQRFLDNLTLNNERYVVGNQNNGPRLHEYLQEMNQSVLEPFSMVSIGEAPDSKYNDARMLVDPKRNELDMIFTFEHMHVDRKPKGENGRWDLQKLDIPLLKEILSKWQIELENHGWNALYFENHDRARTPSRWGNDKEYRYESATAFATILHGLKGTPFVYQGEEIGMTNPEFNLEDYEDIELKTNYQKYVKDLKTISKDNFLKAARKISRDNARTPMQWNHEMNAGFTSGRPWFYVNDNYKTVNVEKDIQSAKSVFKYYQSLIKLRHDYPILTNGSYKLLIPDDPNIFAYMRTWNNEQWIVIANLTEYKIDNPLNKRLFNNSQVILSNTKDQPDIANLLPYQATIYQLKQ